MANPKLKNVRKAPYNGCLKYLNAPTVINLFPLSDGDRDVMLQSTMRTVIVDKHPKIEYLRKSKSVIWSRSKYFSIKADVANSIKLISNPLGPVPNILSNLFISIMP